MAALVCRGRGMRPRNIRSEGISSAMRWPPNAEGRALCGAATYLAMTSLMHPGRRDGAAQPGRGNSGEAQRLTGLGCGNLLLTRANEQHGFTTGFKPNHFLVLSAESSPALAWQRSFFLFAGRSMACIMLHCDIKRAIRLSSVPKSAPRRGRGRRGRAGSGRWWRRRGSARSCVPDRGRALAGQCEGRANAPDERTPRPWP